jgi:hypothetical protein
VIERKKERSTAWAELRNATGLTRSLTHCERARRGDVAWWAEAGAPRVGRVGDGSGALTALGRPRGGAARGHALAQQHFYPGRVGAMTGGGQSDGRPRRRCFQSAHGRPSRVPNARASSVTSALDDNVARSARRVHFLLFLSSCVSSIDLRTRPWPHRLLEPQAGWRRPAERCFRAAAGCLVKHQAMHTRVIYR